MTTDIPSHDPDSPQRALKTLLLADLVNSTALVESMGDDRAAQIFTQCDYLLRDLLVRHNGLEIDKTDGFLLIFDRPIDAVRFFWPTTTLWQDSRRNSRST